MFFGSETLQTATANGDTRSISLHNLHTKENITVTFKRSGRYDEAALKQLNWFLRDWRREEETRIDPQLFDLLWEVYRDVSASQPISVICGYRSPTTNMMLRRRSRGVARNSQHTLGKAIDFAIPGVPLERLRVAGLRLQRGGIGFYPTSGSPFVHMDIGGVRHWPRMTREQLVKVFPNERTVHIPTDGHPLSGYALALADVQRHGGSPSELSLTTARNEGVIDESGEPTASSRSNLLARIFGSAPDDHEGADAAQPAPRTRIAAAIEATARTAAPVALERVPLPKLRPARAPTVLAAVGPALSPKPVESKPLPAPAATYRLASVEPTAKVDVSAQAKATAHAALTPNQIINVRGYWVGIPETRSLASAMVANAEIGRAHV